MANKESIFITIENLGVVDRKRTTRCFVSWIDRWEYGRRVKKYEGFRVDVKCKSIKDKVRREVFDVDESLDIEISRASSFQVRRIHVDETKVNAVRDWSSYKTFPEDINNKVADAFQEEDKLKYTEPLDGEAEQIKKGPALKVTEIFKVPLAIGKHYNELVTCDVVDIEACHVLLGRPWQHDMDATHQGKSNMYLFKWSGKTIAILSLSVVSPKTKLENKTLVKCKYVTRNTGKGRSNDENGDSYEGLRLNTYDSVTRISHPSQHYGVTWLTSYAVTYFMPTTWKASSVLYGVTLYKVTP
ncbi:hypothetical protein Tco_1194802 [Tanacetum coccineum]